MSQTSKKYLENYIHFFAFTKYVKKGGNITQNHSGLNTRNNAIPTNDKSVYIQYNPVDSDEDVISFFNFVIYY